MNPLRTYQLQEVEPYQMQTIFTNSQPFIKSLNNSEFEPNKNNLLSHFKPGSRAKVEELLSKFSNVNIEVTKDGHIKLPQGETLTNDIHIIKYILYPQLLRHNKPKNINQVMSLLHGEEQTVTVKIPTIRTDNVNKNDKPIKAKQDKTKKKSKSPILKIDASKKKSSFKHIKWVAI